ncbi:MULTISPECIES: leucyl aminopeptidase family protein [unclassified Sphingomonas]|uniref:leucyl aminopeptidase family protein n=1 Tax=unclassified Sphingomonas TaxID=196159 RepID=UPI00092659A0|nr:MULTISPECIES: leucyl aminopeptidase family protein [unclassified Sphingomonas]OJU19248.1 MAG: aminopeptidase [Sphingomonas sp. 66-10]
MTDFSPMLQPDRGQPARALHIVHPDAFADWLAGQPPRVRSTVAANRVAGKAGERAVLPGEAAEDWSYLLVCNEPEESPWRIASLGTSLPEGTYRLASGEPGAAMLGWLLGQYRFDRYRADPAEPRVLLSGEPARIEEALRVAEATALVRDLVNTGAGDLGPAELEAAAEALAKKHNATLNVTRGDALATGYPMIHAVGRAAAKENAPRLIELEWGDAAHPRIALVGKGVCFDSGGLDIKPAAGMRLMKKDMGGAAHMLALAGLVMAARLKVRLHLLIPAVENAVSGNAFRPGDVLRTRKGLTVENTNTDAEGRLILGDALAKAVEAEPALILDFATLTGAARVALGPDLPPLFANDDALAAELLDASVRVRDPLWRMPLWDGYDEMLKSDVADMVNSPEGGFAGAVTAALFLRRFVPDNIAWAHVDTFAWRPAAKAGRPKGGDALGLRAAWEVLKARYS